MRITALGILGLAILAAPSAVRGEPVETLRQPATVPVACALIAAPPGCGPASKPASERESGRGAARLLAVTQGQRPSPAVHHALIAPPGRQVGQPPPRSVSIIIDVLVAYTKRAARNYGDIQRDLIVPALEGTNASFTLSGLGHIWLRLVYSYQTDYLEHGMHFDHVWRFADKGDGEMDEVHALRDAYRADIAVLIVDDPKGCGLATRVRAEAEDAFAVVHHACALANYTLAHEIGHLLGASHDRAYVHGRQWRDIMSSAASCGGCPRLPLWSSPKVLVQGEPAGSQEFDNARVIAEEAARVAAFR